MESGLLPTLPDLVLGIEQVELSALFWNVEALIAFLFSQAPVTPAVRRPEILGGDQLVIIVGIVCATVLLLPVLILIVKRTHRNKRYRASLTSWVGRLEVRTASNLKWKRVIGP